MSEGYLWWRPLHAPGFDGWVTLVRQTFETEDQVIYAEKRELRKLGRRQRQWLAERGVEVDRIELRFECGIVYNPPEEGDERLWAIEYFKDRMVEHAAGEEELLARLLEHQAMVHAKERAFLSSEACASGVPIPPLASPSPSDVVSVVVERAANRRLRPRRGQADSGSARSSPAPSMSMRALQPAAALPPTEAAYEDSADGSSRRSPWPQQAPRQAPRGDAAPRQALRSGGRRAAAVLAPPLPLLPGLELRDDALGQEPVGLEQMGCC